MNLQDIQTDSEALAVVLAGGMSTERDQNFQPVSWRIAVCRPLAEKIVRLVTEELELYADERPEVCGGEFKPMDGGRYFQCTRCGKAVPPLQFHEAQRAHFGPHWFDESKQRLRFDAPPVTKAQESAETTNTEVDDVD